MPSHPFAIRQDLKCESRYDLDDKFGFIKATIDFALERDELRDDVMSYMQSFG
ncbi:MAG: hypothetical protein ACRC17_05485 [Culicoidibacterales bacterium]